VVATGKGKVVFAGYRSGYGQTVIIQHPYGFMTMYGHNSSILVNVGETVSRGEVIARAGSSGNSTGPHVHYEVFVKGVNVDPGEFC
jgi:murein DD-endopeptidase MepM/ murein hydrolase activator NlpD